MEHNCTKIKIRQPNSSKHLTVSFTIKGKNSSEPRNSLYRLGLQSFIHFSYIHIIFIHHTIKINSLELINKSKYQDSISNRLNLLSFTPANRLRRSKRMRSKTGPFWNVKHTRQWHNIISVKLLNRIGCTLKYSKHIGKNFAHLFVVFLKINWLFHDINRILSYHDCLSVIILPQPIYLIGFSYSFKAASQFSRILFVVCTAKTGMFYFCNHIIAKNCLNSQYKLDVPRDLPRNMIFKNKNLRQFKSELPQFA